MIPNNVQIEITNRCNQDCIYCPHSKMTRKIDTMSLDNFKVIVNKCKDEGIKTITPFLNGESFLLKDIFDYLNYIKNQGLRIRIVSNMTVVFPHITDKIFELFNYADTFTMSIDGVNEENYKKFKKYAPPFQQREDNIQYFLKKYKELDEPFMLGIQGICSEFETIQSFKMKYDNMSSNVCDVNSVFQINWAGVIESNWQGHGNNFCPKLYKDMTVMVNGDVCLCCLDYNGNTIIGNIFKQNIKDIYNSEVMLKHRNSFPQGICKRCNAI